MQQAGFTRPRRHEGAREATRAISFGFRQQLAQRAWEREKMPFDLIPNFADQIAWLHDRIGYVDLFLSSDHVAWYA